MGGARSPNRDLLLLALGLTALRLVAAGAIPLAEDETYMRLWALHLQLGPEAIVGLVLGQHLAGRRPGAGAGRRAPHRLSRGALVQRHPDRLPGRDAGVVPERRAK